MARTKWSWDWRVRVRDSRVEGVVGLGRAERECRWVSWEGDIVFVGSEEVVVDGRRERTDQVGRERRSLKSVFCCCCCDDEDDIDDETVPRWRVVMHADESFCCWRKAWLKRAPTLLELAILILI